MYGVRSTVRLGVWLAMAFGVAGCQTSGGGGGGSNNEDTMTPDTSQNDNASDNAGDLELTDAEKSAVEAGVNGAASMAYATSTAQESTNSGGAARAVEIGTCPTVSAEVSPLGEGGTNGTLVVALGFGEDGQGCTPQWAPTTTCSGSADATISAPVSAETAAGDDAGDTGAGGSVNVAFDSLSCGELALDGSAQVDYVVGGAVVTLEGEWELTLANEDDSVVTTGNGTSEYDVTGYATTIETFEGTVTSDQGSWSLQVVDAISMSYAAYESYIPYGGEISLSGDDIRTVAVRFSEDSPTTGEVEVSVNGGPYVTLNLFAILESL